MSTFRPPGTPPTRRSPRKAKVHARKKNTPSKLTMTEVPITMVPLSFAKKQFDKIRLEARVNARGCYIPKRAPRPDGYVRWTITKKQRKDLGLPGKGELSYYVHQLAWYCKNRTIPERHKKHLSHRCSDERCFNVEFPHVIEEDPDDNMARKNCVVICPKCQELICPHTPACIP